MNAFRSRETKQTGLLLHTRQVCLVGCWQALKLEENFGVCYDFFYGYLGWFYQTSEYKSEAGLR